MVRGIRLRDRLNDLGEKLLCPLGAETPPGRCGNAGWKREGNCVHRVSPVDCSRIRGGCGIDHIIQRVETEGHVVWNPENAVAAAKNCLCTDAISQSDARRKVDLLERNIVPVSRVHEKDVSL